MKWFIIQSVDSIWALSLVFYFSFCFPTQGLWGSLLFLLSSCFPFSFALFFSGVVTVGNEVHAWRDLAMGSERYIILDDSRLELLYFFYSCPVFISPSCFRLDGSVEDGPVL